MGFASVTFLVTGAALQIVGLGLLLRELWKDVQLAREALSPGSQLRRIERGGPLSRPDRVGTFAFGRGADGVSRTFDEIGRRYEVLDALVTDHHNELVELQQKFYGEALRSWLRRGASIAAAVLGIVLATAGSLMSLPWG